MKLSAAIIALNEETDLPGCIRSLSDFDEIVVVDSGSTDGTAGLASGLGAVVLSRRFDSFSAQKQFACDSCSGDWIVSIDADERLSPGFRDALESGARGGAKAFRLLRRTVYLGRELRFGPWSGDAPLRAFARGCAGFGPERVHETLRTPGPAPVLRGARITHRPYSSISEHIGKMAGYSALWAAQERSAGRRAGLADLILRPQWRLFRALVLQMGALDGIPGIAASVSSAVYAWWKYLALYESCREEISRRGGEVG